MEPATYFEDKPMGNCAARVHFVKHAPGHLRYTHATYRIYARSAHKYPALERHESATLASLLVVPIRSVMPEAIWGLGGFEAPCRLVPGPVMLEAASVRFALQQDILDVMAESQAALRDSDAAMLCPRTPPWAARGTPGAAAPRVVGGAGAPHS